MKINKNNLIHDILMYIPLKLVPAIVGLISIILLTRILNPEEYGKYSAAIAITLLLVQISGAWLSNAVLYFYSEYKIEEERVEFRRKVINIQSVISIPSSFACSFTIYLTTNNLLLSIVGGVIVVGQLMQGIFISFLQSSRNINAQSFSVGIQCITQITTLFLLVFFFNGKEVAAAAAVAVGFIAGCCILFIKNKKYNNKTNSSKGINNLFKKLLTYGYPLCIWFFSTQFYNFGDRIYLQFFGFGEKLGQYASFRDIATGLISFITMPLLMATHPIIMETWRKNNNSFEVERILEKNIIGLSCIFSILMVLTDIIGPSLVNYIFGQRYMQPGIIMLLVVSTIYIGSVALYFQKGLEITGKTLLMAKLSLGVAFISGILNYLLIPIFDVVGAASITLLSSVVYLLVTIIAVRKSIYPKIKIYFLLKLFSSFVMVDILTSFIIKSLHINLTGIENIVVTLILITLFSLFVLIKLDVLAKLSK